MYINGEIQSAFAESFTTGTRPAAADNKARIIFDSTTNKFQYSDGTSWLDASGISSVILTDTQEPTGWLTITGTLSFTEGTRTFNMTGTDSYYIKGVKYSVTNIEKQISTTTGLHWIYYDNDNAIQESLVFPGTNYVLIATVYWNNTTSKGLLANERHGITMDWATHSYLHDTVGCRYESGLAGSFTNTTFSIATGIVHDEDLEINITPAQTACSVIYKDGAADFTWDLSATAVYKTVTGVIQYNNVNALANVDNGKFVAYWVFATNDITNPIVSIMGQRQDITLNAARAGNTYETLSFNTIPYQEMKLLYRVIYHNANGTPTYDEATDYRAVSTLAGGNFVANSHLNLSDLTNGNAGHTQFVMNPMDAAGDVIYNDANLAPAKLAKGDNGQVMTLDTGLPSWKTPSGGSSYATSEKTTAFAMATLNEYICNHAETLVVGTLPETAAVGARFRMIGKGVAGWKVAQNASQYIVSGVNSSLAGVTGFIQSGDSKAVVEIVCTVANTEFTVVSIIGSIIVQNTLAYSQGGSFVTYGH